MVFFFCITTKKDCKKPCCENKHGHSHGGQQQQQQIPPQIQQALAQGLHQCNLLHLQS